MDRFRFWNRWLFVMSLMIVAFGILLAVFNQNPLFNLFNHQIDPVFWADDSIPDAYSQFQSWVYGVLGSTMAGWGLMLVFLTHYSFRQRQKWTWYAIAVSLGFWYLLDTAISISFGVNFNAVFNTLLLFLVLLPLIFTYKAFIP